MRYEVKTGSGESVSSERRSEWGDEEKREESGEMKGKEGEGVKCGYGKVKTTRRLLTKRMISKNERNGRGKQKLLLY